MVAFEGSEEETRKLLLKAFVCSGRPLSLLVVMGGRRRRGRYSRAGDVILMFFISHVVCAGVAVFVRKVGFVLCLIRIVATAITFLVHARGSMGRTAIAGW